MPKKTNQQHILFLLMILIARHGETEWNEINRMQGQENSPLTEEGLNQANRLAHAVDTYDMDQIFSSPLGRAKETANIVAKHAALPMEINEQIQEIDIGAYSGLTKKEVKDHNPDFFERREANKWTWRWPDGESYADASKRVADFIASKESLHGTVIVAHRSLNRVLVGALLDLSPEETLDIEQENDRLLKVYANGEYEKLRYEDVISV